MIARNVINTVTRRPHLAETNAIVRAFARAVFGRSFSAAPEATPKASRAERRAGKRQAYALRSA